MKIYNLATPTVKAQAKKLYEEGRGDINNEEVLRELYHLLFVAKEEVVFNRLDKDRKPGEMVKYDLKRIGECLAYDLYVFPIEEYKNND